MFWGHWNPLMIEESTDPRMPGRAYQITLGGSQFEEPEASLESTLATRDTQEQ